MKSKFLAAGVAAATLMAPAAMAAGTHTLNVSATVNGSCTFDLPSSAMSFGAIDPAGTLPATTSASVDFHCTSGQAYTVTLAGTGTYSLTGPVTIPYTAAITGGFVALADAIDTLAARKQLAANPLHGQVAAVSVGIVNGIAVLDLEYAEDVDAETDMNVVMNSGGAFIEVQGTAEGHAFRREELDAMLDLAVAGAARLFGLQAQARE